MSLIMSVGEPGRLRLSEQLCFAVYDASNAITRAYRAGLAELGLTYPQYLVLLVLWERDPQTTTDIALQLHLASHAVTPIVTRLAGRGLVKRTIGQHSDLRRVDVHLTASGRALHDPAAHVQLRVAEAWGLNAADLAALRDQLKHVSRHLDRTL